ncbi:hypothetical protein D9757_006800 [Collybiopsis confluens]|uniref:C3H1-type domain-containing protein n=1 Tax=Collybiopsis confluens TaxID=2823264 RepID=A0A8H5HLP2_9AGAR|nr:hypothetical protein D9757_006800 [Collybiopsis confluens]
MMPPLPSKVPDEYAQRTPCKKHTMIYTGTATGSMRWDTWSDCEYRSSSYTCRYSHDIFNAKRIFKLGHGVIRLNFGYGFERYGRHESDSDGWDIELNGVILCSDSETTFNLPKSILLAEMQSGLIWKNSPEHQYENKQSLCQAHQNGLCARGSSCHYDHDLIDGDRLRELVPASKDGFRRENFMTVECHNPPSGLVRWKIIMKPDAFKDIDKTSSVGRSIPPAPFSREGADLLQVVREIEAIVNPARVARQNINSSVIPVTVAARQNLPAANQVPAGVSDSTPRASPSLNAYLASRASSIDRMFIPAHVFCIQSRPNLVLYRDNTQTRQSVTKIPDARQNTITYLQQSMTSSSSNTLSPTVRAASGTIGSRLATASISKHESIVPARTARAVTNPTTTNPTPTYSGSSANYAYAQSSYGY